MRVPGSTSNLGPAFDCCGLALGIYAEIEFLPRDQGFEFHFEGEGSEVFLQGENNLVLQAAERLWMETETTPPGAFIHVKNSIPLFSGLGSSGAAIVGGLLAAREFAQVSVSNEQLVTWGTELEGHPDNVAASLLGGLVFSSKVDDSIVARAYHSPVPVAGVIFLPNLQVSTRLSREALSAEIPREDAVFNMGRVANLAAAYATGRLSEVPFAFEDRLHQPGRAQKMPYLHDAIRSAYEAGAFGAFLSGSGPSVAALCEPAVEVEVAEAFRAFQQKEGLQGRVLTLPVDDRGARILS